MMDKYQEELMYRLYDTYSEKEKKDIVIEYLWEVYKDEPISTLEWDVETFENEVK